MKFPSGRSTGIRIFVVVAFLSACGGVSDSDSTSGHVDGSNQRVELRLGYFPNLTHAPAIAAIETGLLKKQLGDGVSLKATTFPAGPAAVEALFSRAIDATFIGPGPATNAFVRSKGKEIRIVSGVTSGGAFLVVKPSINSPDDLKGKRIASPQLGNTQDIALRTWLKSKKLKTTIQGGGDVSVLPQDNAQSLETFRDGSIDGAWVPEPWATRLIVEGGGKVLVDERDLWPNRMFATTLLIVRTEFLRKNPKAVISLVEANLQAIEQLKTDDPAKSQKLINKGIGKVSKPLPARVISESWINLEFTADPVASSISEMAKDAEGLKLLPSSNIDGIFDLRLLNKALRRAGKPEIKQS